MSENKLEKSTLWEKMIYGIGNVGANLCWTFMLIYVTMYYTDSAAVSAAAVGTVMLVARILDGISDVIGAIIIERAHLPLGKIRPWFLIAAPMLGISLWLCFHVPATMSDSGKNIYVFVTYTFTTAVAYTIYNLAFSSILPLMSMDSNDRNKTSIVGNLITQGGVMIMSMATPVLLGMWGGVKEQGAWNNLVTIYAILCAVLVFSMGLFIKEKTVPAEATVTEKGSTAKLLKIVLSSKYTWILLFVFVCFYLASGIAGISTYYIRDVLGRFEMYGVISMVSMLITLVTIPFVSAIVGKIGKRRTVIIGLILYCVGNLAVFVVGRNLMAYMVSTAVSNIGLAPIMALMYTYLADLVDYFARKNHIRVEGFVSMASSVGTKIGSGLGGAVVGWGLALCGYDALVEVQSAATQFGIILIKAGIPVLMSVLMIAGIWMWNLDKAE